MDESCFRVPVTREIIKASQSLTHKRVQPISEAWGGDLRRHPENCRGVCLEGLSLTISLGNTHLSLFLRSAISRFNIKGPHHSGPNLLATSRRVLDVLSRSSEVRPRPHEKCTGPPLTKSPFDQGNNCETTAVN